MNADHHHQHYDHDLCQSSCFLSHIGHHQHFFYGTRHPYCHLFYSFPRNLYHNAPSHDYTDNHLYIPILFLCHSHDHFYLPPCFHNDHLHIYPHKTHC
ncbi:hypothetical protein VIGAN_08003400 [Vigna angularis var. angularis]|uniref:Uncharacterized protein n=1 Tax=Vigna angularis var. angularis TaxID=157739 RepID=A0A0S3SKY4_PHAAN|nr:hypothetical protein VIGAN_08003400 [Vigna angularis var. angularis]